MGRSSKSLLLLTVTVSSSRPKTGQCREELAPRLGSGGCALLYKVQQQGYEVSETSSKEQERVSRDRVGLVECSRNGAVGAFRRVRVLNRSFDCSNVSGLQGLFSWGRAYRYRTEDSLSLQSNSKERSIETSECGPAGRETEEVKYHQIEDGVATHTAFETPDGFRPRNPNVVALLSGRRAGSRERRNRV